MSERTEQLLDEIVRLMALQLREGMESQTAAILAFRQAGLEPARIAELLGTTSATVRATRPKPEKKPASKGGKTTKSTKTPKGAKTPKAASDAD